METEADRPVFVLACAWRSGSTLLQRVLSTSPSLHVWGESHGVVESLAQAADSVGRHSHLADDAAQELGEHGVNGFIANLSPPVETARGQAARAWLRAFYEAPTLALGKPRWGFKEVRCDAEQAGLLLEAFPGGRVIFLLRNPVAVLASMAAAHWYRSAGGARGVMSRWRKLTESFLSWSDPRALIVRYEELTAQPAAEMARIGRHVGIPAADFDPRVFDRVVRGPPGQPRIEAREAIWLRMPSIRRAALRAGYPDPASDPRAGWGRALAADARRVLGKLRSLTTPANGR